MNHNQIPLAYFKQKPEASVEADIAHFSRQLEVAEALHANPVIVEYIKDQIDIVTSELMNASSLGQSPEIARGYLVQCQNQIRAYDHLYGLAANIVEIRNTLTTLTTEGNTQ